MAAAPLAATAVRNSAVTGDAHGAAGVTAENLVDTPAAEPLLSGIARLKAQQATLRAERKRVQKELKNAEKRRSRLKKRARQLSDADLVAVLQMRDATTSPGASLASAEAASSAATPVAGAPANALRGA